MSSTPFRFVQRRTTVSGRVPTTTSLLTGEIYLQVADGTIYFKDAYQDKLHTVITDASGFGLNKLKFSGAVSGDIPLWDGTKIIPYNTGSFAFGSGSGSSTVGVLGSGYGLNSIQQSGSNNYSSGDYSVTIGSGNSANEDFSFALGKDAKTSNFGEFAFSNGSFSEKGDSQYSFVMGRATTSDSTPTKILINNSDKIIQLDLGSTVFFTANVVGAGNDKYISNEIRGVIKRSQVAGSQISFVNSPSKSIFALSPSNSNFSVNVSVSTSDNSLKIECVGDSTEEMIWFAKIDLITIKKSPKDKLLYFNTSIGGSVNYFDVNNWYLDNLFTVPATYIADDKTNAIMSGPLASYANIDNALWITPKLINTLNVTDPSGIILFSETGKIFAGTIIGNSTFDGAVAGYDPEIYFNSNDSNDINYFDETNWYLDNLFTIPSTFIPNSSSLVIISGSSAVTVNIDNLKWQTPAIINSSGITNPSGIILTSATGKVFTGIIIGNSTLDGVIAGYPIEEENLNIYFNTNSANYFDVANWYLDNSFNTASTFIPRSDSLVSMSGNPAVIVNIDDPLWVTPAVINTLNIANTSGIILTSATGKRFTGTIIGNSTFSGAVPYYNINNVNIYFNSVNNDYFNINNWYLDNAFTTRSNFIPDSSSLVTLSGILPVIINIDNAQWQTPAIINSLGIENPSGVVLTSTTGKRFAGVIIGNSTFSGAMPFYNPEQQDINLYFNSSDNDYYNTNNWYLDNSYNLPSTFIPNLHSLITMSVNSIVMVNIDNPLWVTPKVINTSNVANISGIILTSATGKIFTGTIIGNSTFSGAIPNYS